jgi:hypothetical protein
MDEIEAPAAGEAVDYDAVDYDAVDYDAEVAALRARQNFALAIPAGIAAAIVGAALWAGFVYVTEYELGLIAIAVGALVGLAVRAVGHGVDMKFGILGAACAAFGWALGLVLCDLAFLARETGQPFLDVVGRMGVGNSVSLAVEAADAMELLFLAIAVYEGYRFSFRHRLA